MGLINLDGIHVRLIAGSVSKTSEALLDGWSVDEKMRQVIIANGRHPETTTAPERCGWQGQGQGRGQGQGQGRSGARGVSEQQGCGSIRKAERLDHISNGAWVQG